MRAAYSAKYDEYIVGTEPLVEDQSSIDSQRGNTDGQGKEKQIQDDGDISVCDGIVVIRLRPCRMLDMQSRDLGCTRHYCW
jgi:hypothetical protein